MIRKLRRTSIDVLRRLPRQTQGLCARYLIFKERDRQMRIDHSLPSTNLPNEHVHPRVIVKCRALLRSCQHKEESPCAKGGILTQSASALRDSTCSKEHVRIGALAYSNSLARTRPKTSVARIRTPGSLSSRACCSTATAWGS